MAIEIPLKRKYRNPDRRMLRRNGIDPPEGTLVFFAGGNKAKTANAGTVKKGSSIRPRRKAYGPF